MSETKERETGSRLELIGMALALGGGVAVGVACSMKARAPVEPLLSSDRPVARHEPVAVPADLAVARPHAGRQAGCGSVGGRIELADASDRRRLDALAGSALVTPFCEADGRSSLEDVDSSVVFLRGKELDEISARSASAEPVIVTRTRSGYEPSLLAVAAGATVEFRNRDRTLHTLHCRSRWKPLNVAMAANDDHRVRFEKPDVVGVTCSMCEGPKAVIVVLGNGFFARPRNGEFAIAGVPPGRWEVACWYRGKTRRGGIVAVRESESARHDLVLPVWLNRDAPGQ